MASSFQRCLSVLLPSWYQCPVPSTSHGERLPLAPDLWDAYSARLHLPSAVPPDGWFLLCNCRHRQRVDGPPFGHGHVPAAVPPCPAAGPHAHISWILPVMNPAGPKLGGCQRGQGQHLWHVQKPSLEKDRPGTPGPHQLTEQLGLSGPHLWAHRWGIEFSSKSQLLLGFRKGPWQCLRSTGNESGVCGWAGEDRGAGVLRPPLGPLS